MGLMLIAGTLTLINDRRKTRNEAIRANVNFFLLGALKLLNDKTGIRIIFLAAMYSCTKKAERLQTHLPGPLPLRCLPTALGN